MGFVDITHFLLCALPSTSNFALGVLCPCPGHSRQGTERGGRTGAEDAPSGKGPTGGVERLGNRPCKHSTVPAMSIKKGKRCAPSRIHPRHAARADRRALGQRCPWPDSSRRQIAGASLIPEGWRSRSGELVRGSDRACGSLGPSARCKRLRRALRASGSLSDPGRGRSQPDPPQSPSCPCSASAPGGGGRVV